MTTTFDLAVVGGGIAGLAHAHAAARLGKRVVVIDREPQLTGASVRGYGLNLLTGQQRGISWQRARRSREILLEIAHDSGIAVEPRGMMTVALRPEGLGLCESFQATEMGEGCQMLTAAAARKRLPALKGDDVLGALWSPHELRYDPRAFAAAFARWLGEAHKVQFMRGVHVRSVFPSRIDSSAGPVRAETVIVCPGEELLTLFAHRIAHYRLTRCRVQMLRLAPGTRLRLPYAVQSDLGLLACPGFADLPEARDLAVRLSSERHELAPPTVRMLAVQNTDRTVTVGDSRLTAPAPDAFVPSTGEGHILDEFDQLFDVPERTVIERWTGVHLVADRPLIIDQPGGSLRLVMVTGSFGASAAFAIAEDVVADLFGSVTAGAAR